MDLLERLYPNRFSDLAVGRIRYGVMLNDEGVILDDGAVCRVDDDEFFVTVTTGNTAALERWITWWLADWRLDVQILNVTGAFAALNLAGPKARTVMERVTDADVSAQGMPYLACRTFDVAQVPALVLRIGFVGEMGYEIHVPSLFGESVWSAIMAAGADQGITPFGLEAQRILRLEKQHILVGQDTDAESDPYEAGLGWMVKGDKPDFLGKRSLRDLERAGPGERLIGFTSDPAWVPPEGASVVHEGVWVGRVTSARRSAAVGATVGLAWVPAGWANEGTEFEIQFGPSHAVARVALAPVLRSRRGEAPVVSDHRVGSSTAQVPTSLPPLRSPLASMHAAFGSDVTIEGGAEIVRSYGDPERERAALSDTIGLADVTVMSKIDVRGDVDPALSSALDDGVARIAKDWAVVFAAPGPVADRVAAMQAAVGTAAMVTDVTHLYAGFALAGPSLSDALARLTSWDPSGLDVGGATGAPIADVRAIVRRREASVPVMEIWVAMEFARYAWRSILEVVERLGGEPVGWDALRELGWRC